MLNTLSKAQAIKRFFSNFWVKLIVTTVLLVVVFHQVGIMQILADLVHANYMFLGLALLVFIVSNVFGSMSWDAVVRPGMPSISRLSLIESYWKGLFFNLILPTNIGGDVIKCIDVIKRHGREYFFLATVLTDRLVNFFIMALMGGVAFLIYQKKIFLLWVLLLVFLIGSAIFYFLYRHFLFLVYQLIKKMPKQGKRAAFRRLLIKLMPAMSLLKQVFRRKRFVVKLVFYAAMSQFLKIYVSVLVAMGLHKLVSPILIFIIVPIQATVSLLPISINGIGTREYANTLFEGFEGLSAADFSMISLVGFILLSLSSLPALFFFFARLGNKQASD